MSAGSTSRNLKGFETSSTKRYDSNKSKIVLRKAKKSKKLKKTRNDCYLPTAKTTHGDVKTISKTSSTTNLLSSKEEGHHSILSANEKRYERDIKQSSKLKVIKKSGSKLKAVKSGNNSVIEQSLTDDVPVITVAQVKKPYYGIKPGIVTEFSNCKQYTFDGKRSSLTGLQPRSTKNSYRELLCTPSALNKENRFKNTQVNIIYPKKKTTLKNIKDNSKLIEGVKQFVNNNIKSEIRSELKLHTAGSATGSQSRNVAKYLTTNSATTLSKSNSIKRFQPVCYSLQSKKLKTTKGTTRF